MRRDRELEYFVIAVLLCAAAILGALWGAFELMKHLAWWTT